jgi:hypothetical protein
MAKLPAFEPIEFLVARKFGLSSGFGAEGRARSDPKLAKEIAIYEERLVTFSPEEFKALLESERAKQQAEHAAKLEREERERFFHQPYAEADIDHWSKAAHWTLDEAIALSFGKAPERVSWERIKPLTEISAFAGHYHRRRDLALRAMTWQQLFDPVLPGIFLAWAKRNDLAVPPELEAAITARGIQVADWKTLFEKQKSAFDENHSQWLALAKEKNEQIERLLRQIEELQARLDSMPSLVPPSTPEKSMSTRERESLLKLVIGMAVGGYGYDPTAARSEQPAAIADDLSTNGVSLDVDTVRKWLKAGAEQLPQLKTERN